MKRILIVEDEKTIADTLLYVLQAEAFSADWVITGQEALSHNTENNYDCIILDVGLPDISGFEVLKQIRQFSEVPVIFLTARSDEIDRIVGLEIGADDYVTKPFSPREVVTRIKTILKRVKSPVTKTISSHFIVNSEQAKITLKEQLLTLTRAEYYLLSTMLKQPNRVFSRGQLMALIWETPHPSDERTIDTHIKSLRAKIREVDADNEYIQTHRGLGYSVTFVTS